MKLIRDKTDRRVIQNFAGINSSILFRSDTLAVLSADSVVMGRYDWQREDEFEFGVYNVPKLLGILDMMGEDADLTIGETSVSVKAGGKSSRIQLVDPAVIKTPPKTIRFNKDENAKLSVSEEVFRDTLKAASILGSDSVIVTVTPDGGRIYVGDPRDVTADRFGTSVDVENAGDEEFSVSILIEYMKILPGSYDLYVSPRGITYWESREIDGLSYFVACTKIDD